MPVRDSSTTAGPVTLKIQRDASDIPELITPSMTSNKTEGLIGFDT